MSGFWLLAILLTLLAVAFVIWPLWSRQSRQQNEPQRQELVLDLFNEQRHALLAQLQDCQIDRPQFEQLQQELHESLLADAMVASTDSGGRSRSGWLLGAAALLLPLLALTLYWQRGSIDDVEILQLRDAFFEQQVLAARGEANADEQALPALVDSLSARLERQPDNMGNRYLLARAYMQQGNYMAAVTQYSRILSQGEPPANIIAELAQAIFLASGNRASPEMDALVARALQLDPAENTALGLAGISAFEKADYQSAVQYWSKAVQALGPGSPGGRSLQAGIERARQLLAEAGQDAAAAEAGSSAEVEAAAAAASIRIQVSLSADVRVDAADTVFVYARAWQGPKMPLAIARFSAAQLPLLVTLDETMAMAPGMTIRSFSELELVARISKSGDPVATSGDWQGSIGPVILGQLQQPVNLSIENQIP